MLALSIIALNGSASALPNPRTFVNRANHEGSGKLDGVGSRGKCPSRAQRVAADEARYPTTGIALKMFRVYGGRGESKAEGLLSPARGARKINKQS
jgi:hypothetical protein